MDWLRARDLSRRNTGPVDPRWEIARPLRQPTLLRTKVRAPQVVSSGTLTRIFHSRWVARATCPFRRATSPAEARHQTCRVASLRLHKVPVQAWSANCCALDE